MIDEILDIQDGQEPEQELPVASDGNTTEDVQSIPEPVEPAKPQPLKPDYNKLFEIKPEHKNTVIGYNNSGKPLGERDDLHKLALMAHNNKRLADVFVSLPTIEQINEYTASTII